MFFSNIRRSAVRAVASQPPLTGGPDDHKISDREGHARDQADDLFVLRHGSASDLQTLKL
jgi:hypothetical protein